MQITERIKCFTFFFILISTLSYVQTQRLCRYKDRCLDNREQQLQQQYQQSSIPVYSPTPNTQLEQQKQQQQQQQQQQLLHQQHSQQIYEHLGQQQAYQVPQLQNDYNYDSPVAKNISLNILNLAQAMSRQFQHQSLRGEQIFSPISIFSVLQLLLTGANGETYNELNRLLSYRSNMGSPISQEEFGYLIEDLVSDEMNPQRLRPDAEWKFSSVQENDGIDRRNPKKDEERLQKIRLANGVFIQKGINLRPSYRSVIENIYKSQVENVDFRQQDYVEQYINRWVNEKTYGKIPTIIDKSSFDPSTSMIMACAVYFKGFWERPFISGGTMVKDFYPDGTDNPSTSIKVNMMANGGYFPYYDDPIYKIKVIGFPYSKGSSTMYIFQPYDSTRESLKNMQTTLTPEIIEYMISQMKKKNSIFLFPRLHIMNSFSLRDVLRSLGLESVFLLKQSDLSLITEPRPNNLNVDLSQKQAENNRPNSQFQSVLPLYRPSSIVNPRPSISTTNRNPNLAFKSRVGDYEVNTTTSSTVKEEENTRRKRGVTYKVESEYKRNEQPLRFKDLVINKRITKLNKGKKLNRKKRQTTTPNGYLNYLQSIRNSQDLIKPDLFADDILHKIDLVVNEEGTEGAAVTTTFLKRSGPDVIFRAETPFLILLRHDTTKIPIFYGAIFDPTLN